MKNTTKKMFVIIAVSTASLSAANANLIPAHSHWDVHGYTDHEVEFCYDPSEIDSGAGNTLAFLPLREQDSQNFMQLDLQKTGLALQRRINGVFTTVTPLYHTTQTNGVGSDIMIDFTMIGSTYTAYELTVVNGQLQRGAMLDQWSDNTFSNGVNISYYTQPHVAGDWDFVHAFPINGGIGQPHDIIGLHQDATGHNSVTGAATFDDPTPADGDAIGISESSTFGLPSGANYTYRIAKTGGGNGSFDFRGPGDSSNEHFFTNSYYRFRTGAPGGMATIQRFIGSTAGTTYTATAGGPGVYTLLLVGPDIYLTDSNGVAILHVNDGGPQSGLRIRVHPADGESWEWSGQQGDILVPVADNYVSSANSTANYGKATVDYVAGPGIRIENSYLQFPQYVGTPTSATLNFTVTASSSSGLDVHVANSESWGETTETYNTQPGFGPVIATLPSLVAGVNTVTIPIADLHSSGTTTLVLTRTNLTQMHIDSRETSNPPTLTLTY